MFEAIFLLLLASQSFARHFALVVNQQSHAMVNNVRELWLLFLLLLLAVSIICDGLFSDFCKGNSSTIKDGCNRVCTPDIYKLNCPQLQMKWIYDNWYTPIPIETIQNITITCMPKYSINLAQIPILPLSYAWISLQNCPLSVVDQIIDKNKNGSVNQVDMVFDDGTNQSIEAHQLAVYKFLPYELRITSSTAETIEADAFRALSYVHRLSLTNNSFRSLPSKLLQPILELENIHIAHHTGLRTLPNQFLANLTMLIEVTIDSCSITGIPVDMFTGSKILDTIRIENNPKLQTIPMRTFDGLPSLRSLYLNNNQIKLISE